MGARQILVVEDEPDIRELLIHVLRDKGYRVQVAANGEVALAILSRNRVDLVLTDITMPVMNGAELLMAMQATVGLRRIPTLVVSALPEAEVRSNWQCIGPFIQKPFRLRNLIARVNSLLCVEHGAVSRP